MKINLVSSPRNRSTLLMYSFAQRRDTQVVDEPYYAHYLQWSEVQHPGHDEIMGSMQSDIEKVQSSLVRNSESVYFIKNMAHHYREQDFKYLLDFSNLLYIRNPRAIIRSYSQVIDTPSIDDIGINQVLRIYNYLIKNNRSPLILDSDDLVNDPKKTLSALCDALKIPFDAAMLKWSKGEKPYDGIWAKYWYSRVHQSTGFIVQNKTASENIDLSPDLEALAVSCMPAYEVLKQHALCIN